MKMISRRKGCIMRFISRMRDACRRREGNGDQQVGKLIEAAKGLMH